MEITKKQLLESVEKTMDEKKKQGLWANIQAKRERGEKSNKPGEKGYPEKKAWDKAKKQSTNEGMKDIATGENLSIGDVVNCVGCIGDFQVIVKSGKPCLAPFNKETNKADTAHLIPLSMMSDVNMQKVMGFGDTEGGFMSETTAPTNMSIGFTNSNFFSLVDEIILNETGEGAIDDLVITSNKLCEGTITADMLQEMVNEALEEYYMMTEENLNEAEYKGRKVQLGKISKGDRKKYKVHVKNGKGNVVKVEFGDPNMEIKRDNPKRRKSFRARHHCENPGPRWKARYWACKTWSRKPVSKMV